ATGDRVGQCLPRAAQGGHRSPIAPHRHPGGRPARRRSARRRLMFPQLSAAVRVFLCARPTDLRKGFDGLSGLVKECLSQALLTGHLFLFLNRRRDRIEILYFDRDGLVIWYKRLESGTYQQLDPQAHARCVSGSEGIELTVTELALLLTGIDLTTAR